MDRGQTRKTHTHNKEQEKAFIVHTKQQKQMNNPDSSLNSRFRISMLRVTFLPVEEVCYKLIRIFYFFYDLMIVFVYLFLVL